MLSLSEHSSWGGINFSNGIYFAHCKHHTKCAFSEPASNSRLTDQLKHLTQYSKSMTETKFAPKLSVRRVRLNKGGYTPSGRYYGVGQSLFEIDGEDPKHDVWVNHTVRAHDREDAKEQAREMYPHCKFFK